MNARPLICVSDVEASSRWYQQLLGCQSGHGGPHYERLNSPGGLILQMRRWDVEHHHGSIGDPNLTPGNGVLLWFEVGDFDAAVGRADMLQAVVVLPRHRNHQTGTAARTTGKSGYAIPTATRSCFPAPTDQRMETGSRKRTGEANGALGGRRGLVTVLKERPQK